MYKRNIIQTLFEAINDPVVVNKLASGTHPKDSNGWFKGFLYEDGTIEIWSVDRGGELHHEEMKEPQKEALVRFHWVPDTSKMPGKISQLEMLPDFEYTDDGAQYKDISSKDKRLSRIFNSIEDVIGDTTVSLYNFNDIPYWSGTVDSWLEKTRNSSSGSDVRSHIRRRLGVESYEQ